MTVTIVVFTAVLLAGLVRLARRRSVRVPVPISPSTPISALDVATSRRRDARKRAALKAATASLR